MSFLDTIYQFNSKKLSVTSAINKGFQEATDNSKTNLHQGLRTFFTDVQTQIRNIENKSFAWNLEHNKIDHYFETLSKIDSKIMHYLLDISPLHQQIPINYFSIYLKVNIGQIGGGPYDKIMKSYSKIMGCFKNCYLNYILVGYFQMDTATIHFYDPFFRQKIRIKHQSDKKIQEAFFGSFNLKEFIFKGLEKFFPNVGWRWIGSYQKSHIYMLEAIVTMFEYGLWNTTDMIRLLNYIYAVSQIMRNLEIFTQRDARSAHEGGRNLHIAYIRKTQTDFVLIRELFSKILTNIIILYLDEDIYENRQHFPINFDQYKKCGLRIDEMISTSYDLNKIKELFTQSFLQNKKLYTFFPYILVTNLTKRVIFKKQVDIFQNSENLQRYLEKLFTFISDINGDFYRESLKMIDPKYFPFYFLKLKNSVEKKNSQLMGIVQNFKAIQQEFRKMTENNLKTKFDEFYNKIKESMDRFNHHFQSQVSNNLNFNCQKIIATVYDLCHHFIVLIQIFQDIETELIPQDYPSEHEKLKLLYKLVIKGLILISKNNTAAQNYVFSPRAIIVLTDVINNLQHSPYVYPFIYDTFESSYVSTYLLKNLKLRKLLLDIFEEQRHYYINLFNKEEENVIQIKDISTVTKDEFQSLSQLYIGSRIFVNFLSRKFLNKISIQIKLQDEQFLELLKLTLDFLFKFDYSSVTSQQNFLNEIHKNPYEFQNKINKFEELSVSQKNCLIIELSISSLELIFYCCKEFFLKGFYDKIIEILTIDRVIKFQTSIMTIPYGLNIIQQLINLNTIYHIFPQNHLVNEEELKYLGKKQEEAEISDVDDIDIEFFNENHFENYFQIGKNLVSMSKNHNNLDKLNKVFVRSYLAGLFKAFYGYTHSYVQRYKKDQEKKMFQNIMAYADNFMKLNQEFLDSFPQGFFQQKNTKVYFTKELQEQNKAYFSNLMEQIFDKKQNNHYYNNKPNTPINLARFLGYKLLRDILRVFYETNTSFVFLHHYKIQDTKNRDSMIFKSMKNSLQFNSVFRQDNQEQFIQGIKIPGSDYLSKPFNVRKFLKEYYSLQKTYFIENQDENLSFQVLKKTDIQNNNQQLYLYHFLHSMLNYKLKFDKSVKAENKSLNLAGEFFTEIFQQGFISNILMFDNLIRHCEDFKFQFYELLSKDKQALDSDQTIISEETHIKKVLYFLWDIHKLLLKFLLIKTFRDESWTNMYTLFYLISNLLQNLCENDFVNMKYSFNVIEPGREQSLLEEYILYVQFAFKSTDLFRNKSRILQLSDKSQQIDILTRVVEGFTEISNGSAVLNKKICYKEGINRWIGIIMRNIYDIDSNFHDLKDVAMDYILGLIEGYDEDIINYLGHSFPVLQIFQNIVFNLKLLFLNQKNKISSSNGENIKITNQDLENLQIKNYLVMLRYYKKYKNFSDHVILSYSLKLYHFMKRIAKVVKRFDNFIIEQDTNFRNKNHHLKMTNEICIWGFLQKIVVSIEISFAKPKDTVVATQKKLKRAYSQIENPEILEENAAQQKSQLMTIYFQRMPACFFLTRGIKRSFLNNINIDSIDQKHEDFFDRIEVFKIISEYYEKLYKQNEILFIFTTERMFYYYRVGLYLIAALINLIILIYWDRENDDFKDDVGNIKAVVSFLVIISAGFSGLLLLFWFLYYYPLKIQENLELFKFQNNKKKQPSFSQLIEIYIFSSMLKDPNFQTFFLHCLFTILGQFYTPFFYTILLLLVVHLSRTVLNVIMSFLINYDKLFYTFIIILVVINSFSFLLSSHFRNQFYDEEVGDDNLVVCDTYFRCFFNTINLGLRGGGGVSDYILGNFNNKNSNYYLRFGFDLLFFIFVNLILLGIFFGIIVDSFGEFRDKRNKQEQSLQNECICCGLDRAYLEKKGMNFSQHVKYHEIWKYFYYIMYLKWKPESYYDGVDIQVNQCLQQNYSTSWLPIGRTLIIQ